MSLALQSIKYMIWLQLVVILMILFIAAAKPDPDMGLSLLIETAWIGIYYLISKGLKRKYTWVAVLFLVLCIFDVFGAMADGIELASILNLVGAVLSFVAICGIVIWLRERKPEPSAISAGE